MKIPRKCVAIIFAGLVTCLISAVRADESDLRVFGYFQTEFHQENDSGVSSNSFLLQQLNLFFQKDLAKDWTAFVNIEIVNSFSSSRDWGSLNLEEAWVSYRSSEQFKLKLGLHIPEFNNLNSIKNRTPLLPYIIRPFVYETSFGEFFNMEFLTPQRSYVQIYGAIPSGRADLDYSLYVGNSPNIRTGEQIVDDNRNTAPQSGADTTDNFLIGGRFGFRYSGLKMGISATHEKINITTGLEPYLNQPASNFEGMPVIRFGADLSFYWKDLVFESEYLSSSVDRDFAPGLKIDAKFYYATLGYYLNEYLFVYGTMSKLDLEDFGVDITIVPPDTTEFNAYTDVVLPYFGFSYNLNHRIIFKGQVMLVDLKERRVEPFNSMEFYREERDIDRFAIAVSAFF